MNASSVSSGAGRYDGCIAVCLGLPQCYRDEVRDAYVFESIEQVREVTETWLHGYNEERPHGSLGRVPPLTFMPRPVTTRECSFKLCPRRGSLRQQRPSIRRNAR